MDKINIFEDLPDYRSFSYNEVKETARYIRRDLKPAIVNKLKTLYAHDEPGAVENFVDIMGLEIRLQQVDDYLSQLFPIMEKEDANFSPHLKKIELLNQQVEGTQFAQANTRLFFEPCNLSCVHGPVALLYVATLAQQILESGETIRNIVKLSFLQPVIDNLEITIFDRHKEAQTGIKKAAIIGKDGQPVENKNIALEGEFQTSKGRYLYFYATQETGNTVIDEAGRNQFALAFLKGSQIIYDTAADLFRVNIAKESLEYSLQQPPLSPATLLSTIYDIVVIAIMNIRRHQMKHLEYLPMLCVGVNNFSFPGNWAELSAKTRTSQELEIEIRVMSDKTKISSNSGLRFIHFSSRLQPLQAGFSEFVFAETEDMKHILGILHSR